MESLIRFGRGSIQDLSLKPDGSVLVVASAVGVWFYGQPSQEYHKYRLVPGRKTPRFFR